MEHFIQRCFPGLFQLQKSLILFPQCAYFGHFHLAAFTWDVFCCCFVLILFRTYILQVMVPLLGQEDLSLHLSGLSLNIRPWSINIWTQISPFHLICLFLSGDPSVVMAYQVHLLHLYILICVYYLHFLKGIPLWNKLYYLCCAWLYNAAKKGKTSFLGVREKLQFDLLNKTFNFSRYSSGFTDRNWFMFVQLDSLLSRWDQIFLVRGICHSFIFLEG